MRMAVLILLPIFVIGLGAQYVSGRILTNRSVFYVDTKDGKVVRGESAVAYRYTSDADKRCVSIASIQAAKDVGRVRDKDDLLDVTMGTKQMVQVEVAREFARRMHTLPCRFVEYRAVAVYFFDQQPPTVSTSRRLSAAGR